VRHVRELALVDALNVVRGDGTPREQGGRSGKEQP
jgi:hypothetical protein